MRSFLCQYKDVMLCLVSVYVDVNKRTANKNRTTDEQKPNDGRPNRRTNRDRDIQTS